MGSSLSLYFHPSNSPSDYFSILQQLYQVYLSHRCHLYSKEESGKVKALANTQNQRFFFQQERNTYVEINLTSLYKNPPKELKSNISQILEYYSNFQFDSDFNEIVLLIASLEKVFSSESSENKVLLNELGFDNFKNSWRVKCGQYKQQLETPLFNHETIDPVVCSAYIKATRNYVWEYVCAPIDTSTPPGTGTISEKEKEPLVDLINCWETLIRGADFSDLSLMQRIAHNLSCISQFTSVEITERVKNLIHDGILQALGSYSVLHDFSIEQIEQIIVINNKNLQLIREISSLLGGKCDDCVCTLEGTIKKGLTQMLKSMVDSFTSISDESISYESLLNTLQIYCTKGQDIVEIDAHFQKIMDFLTQKADSIMHQVDSSNTTMNNATYSQHLDNLQQLVDFLQQVGNHFSTDTHARLLATLNVWIEQQSQTFSDIFHNRDSLQSICDAWSRLKIFQRFFPVTLNSDQLIKDQLHHYYHLASSICKYPFDSISSYQEIVFQCRSIYHQLENIQAFALKKRLDKFKTKFDSKLRTALEQIYDNLQTQNGKEILQHLSPWENFADPFQPTYILVCDEIAKFSHSMLENLLSPAETTPVDFTLWLQILKKTSNSEYEIWLGELEQNINNLIKNQYNFDELNTILKMISSVCGNHPKIDNVIHSVSNTNLIKISQIPSLRSIFTLQKCLSQEKFDSAVEQTLKPVTQALNQSTTATCYPSCVSKLKSAIRAELKKIKETYVKYLNLKISLDRDDIDAYQLLQFASQNSIFIALCEEMVNKKIQQIIRKTIKYCNEELVYLQSAIAHSTKCRIQRLISYFSLSDEILNGCADEFRNWQNLMVNHIFQLTENLLAVLSSNENHASQRGIDHYYSKIKTFTWLDEILPNEPVRPFFERITLSLGDHIENIHNCFIRSWKGKTESENRSILLQCVEKLSYLSQLVDIDGNLETRKKNLYQLIVGHVQSELKLLPGGNFLQWNNSWNLLRNILEPIVLTLNCLETYNMFQLCKKQLYDTVIERCEQHLRSIDDFPDKENKISTLTDLKRISVKNWFDEEIQSFYSFAINKISSKLFDLESQFQQQLINNMDKAKELAGMLDRAIIAYELYEHIKDIKHGHYNAQWKKKKESLEFDLSFHLEKHQLLCIQPIINCLGPSLALPLLQRYFIDLENSVKSEIACFQPFVFNEHLEKRFNIDSFLSIMQKVQILLDCGQNIYCGNPLNITIDCKSIILLFDTKLSQPIDENLQTPHVIETYHVLLASYPGKFAITEKVLTNKKSFSM